MARRSPRPVTDEDTERVRQLHADGKSVRAIAREMDRSASTIRDIGKRLHLSWDRSQTAAATAAKQADLRAIRAERVAWAYQQIGEIAQRLAERPYRTVGRDEDGATTEVTLSVVPAKDMLDLSRSIGVLAKVAVDLEKVDASAGTDDARSMVGALVEMLQANRGQQ